MHDPGTIHGDNSTSPKTISVAKLLVVICCMC